MKKRGYKKRANRFGQFTSLLMQGCLVLKAAKQLSIPTRTAYKWTHRAVEEKLIEPVCKWPLIYQKARKWQTGSNLVANLPFSPIFIPHRFGGSFLQTGRPEGILYDKNGRFFDGDGNHKIQLGRNHTLIWIKHFRGSNALEIMKNAFEDMQRFAEFYSKTYGIVLTLERVFDGVEWHAADKFISKGFSKTLGLKDGEQKQIAETLFKNGDSSHPHLLEINKAPNQPAIQPTNVVKEFEYIVHNYRKNDETLKLKVAEVYDALLLSAKAHNMQRKTNKAITKAVVSLHKEVMALKPEPSEPPKKFGEKPEGNDYR